MTSPGSVIHVVPHTHWDREWYETFESHRYRLVHVMDQLLEVLESDPGFHHFLLDGQTAMVEDYLAVRPERAAAVAAMVAGGRLSAGPWRILMDEFLCSPETILRNLEQGHALARRLGGGMQVGYLPDMFGHISQMPQILRLAGIADACVWRGVPSSIDRTVFWWEAPDGSRVRTASMPGSYSNARLLPESVEDLLTRAKEIIEAMSPFSPGRVILGMNGDDHAQCQPQLPGLFAAANERQNEIEFRIGSLEEYLAGLPEDAEWPVWRGELRSSASGNLLIGVASARMPLKQAEWRATTELERFAEPLAAISGLDAGRLPEIAWRGLVESSAHDSICGCAIDEVADDVAARYEQASRIAELMAADALERLAARIDADADGVVVFNPSPVPRSGVVEVAVSAPVGSGLASPGGPSSVLQMVEVDQETLNEGEFTADEFNEALPELVGLLKARAPMGGKWIPNAASVSPGAVTKVTVVVGTERRGDPDPDAFTRDARAALRQHPDGRFAFRLVTEPATRGLTWAQDVGGIGWTVLQPADSPPSAPPHAVHADDGILDNGLVRIEVTDDAAVRMLHHESGTVFDGLFRLEDGADAGDEYNYSPPPRDRVIREPSGRVTVETIESGPLRAIVRIDYALRVPAGLSDDRAHRSRRSVTMPVRLGLTLHAGEPFVRATITVDNDATDHRLRVVFGLPMRAEQSHADSAFHVAQRGLQAEGAAFEHGLPTYPCRRWVDASDGQVGLAVFHRGTPEYELVDGSALAVTLLRSVGWMSRSDLTYRSGGAGPNLPSPGAQIPGRHVFDLAVYPHGGDWRTGDVPGHAETFACGLRATPVRSDRPRDLPSRGSALTIEPTDVRVSALHRLDDETLTCRVWNDGPHPADAVVRMGPFLDITQVQRTDLFGDGAIPLALHDDTVRLALRPWEIANLRLCRGPR